MKRTRRVKRKPHGTLRKSRRYRRGGSYSTGYRGTYFNASAVNVNVAHGGKRRKRSSRSKRGGYPPAGRFFYGSKNYQEF